MVMDLKRRSNSITPTSLAYHTAGAITRRVDGRPGAHFRTPKCIVKESSDNSNVLVCNQTICEEMQKFPNSLMLMYDNRSQQKIGGSGVYAGDSHTMLSHTAMRNRPMDDFFLLDFAASTTTTTAATSTHFENKDKEILLVGKKVTTTSPSSTTSLSNRRKTMSLSPVLYTTLDDQVESHHQTMHHLKVSAVPLTMTSQTNGRIKVDGPRKTGGEDIQGFEKPDGEDGGSTLADFLNLLSPDPGFESACGGDCSPPPVDLSALDGLSLDFPLNGCCNGDTGYGSSSSLGGGSPPSSVSSSSVLHPSVEGDHHFCKQFPNADHQSERKPLLASGMKRKVGYSNGSDHDGQFVAKKSFTELSPSPAKRPNTVGSIAVSKEIPVAQFSMTAGRDVSDIGYPSSSYTLSNPDKPDLAYRSTETASSLIPDKGVPVTKENEPSFVHEHATVSPATELALVTEKMSPKCGSTSQHVTNLCDKLVKEENDKTSRQNFEVKLEDNSSCYSHASSLADRLLQQCLVPVLPNARELNMGAWFRCRLCHRVEPTTRLLAHAGHAHRITEIATAAAECISSCYQEQMTNGASWCEGPFPSDLVDVALSSPADNPFEDPTTSSSSVRSPPSTDLITLDPPDNFVDADFDVVDDMKFIDSLIQTMPTEDDHHQNKQTSNHEYATVQQHFDSNNRNNNNNNNVATSYLPCTNASPNQNQPQQQHQPVSSMFLENNVSTFVIANHRPAVAVTSFAGSPDKKTSMANHYGNSSGGKKSSPQFRWRRRKRRSKAQYPEMSRYLLPIDDGEEVQHLGRTLECTLCGLRGKRCHLTLHFKAKHNEVIDLSRAKNLAAAAAAAAAAASPNSNNKSSKSVVTTKQQQLYLSNNGNSSNNNNIKLNEYSMVVAMSEAATSISIASEQQPSSVVMTRPTTTANVIVSNVYEGTQSATAGKNFFLASTSSPGSVDLHSRDKDHYGANFQGFSTTPAATTATATTTTALETSRPFSPTRYASSSKFLETSFSPESNSSAEALSPMSPRMLMSVDSSLSYSSSSLSSPIASPLSPDLTWPPSSTINNSNSNNNNNNMSTSKVDENVDVNQEEEEDEGEVATTTSTREEWRLRRKTMLSFLRLTEKELTELDLELEGTSNSLALALETRNTASND